MTRLTHPWPPVFDRASRVLVLGTFPSPASRAFGFFYGHPGNVFWRVLADVLGAARPSASVASRREFLLARRVAVWDVLRACEIDGARDASIRDPEPNAFRWLLDQTRIRKVFTTGRTATRLFDTLCADEARMTATYLPSTSPANRAAQARPEFLEAWRQVAVAMGPDSE